MDDTTVPELVNEAWREPASVVTDDIDALSFADV